MYFWMKRCALCCCLALGVVFGFTGCGAGTANVAAGVSAPVRPAFAVSGTVFGGQQAVVGAHVYLMGATGSGVGSNSGSGLPSISLLNSAQTGNLDSVGSYVLTNASGGFSLSGDYAACTSSPTNAAQLYLYVVGGDPGAGMNAAAGFLAALGTCSSIGGGTKVSVNELSTVAAAYALAGFATSATDISVGSSAIAQTGLQNAMLNAQQMVGLASGLVLTTTANGNGTPDMLKINTLANILAACVNSTGNSGACSTLFNNALSSGGTGTKPTDTATAAIYIAQHPYVSPAVMGNLYNLQQSVGAPYQGLSQQPSDFTVGIRYTGGGLSGAHAVAIDASGNALVTNTGGSVTQFTSTGVASSSGASAGATMTEALDGAQSAWYSTGTAGVVEQNSAAVTVSPATGFTGGQNSSPTAVATDGSGDVWVTNADGVSVSELIGAATPVVTPIAAPSGNMPAAGVNPSQPATASSLSDATVVHQVQLDGSLYGHNVAVSNCLAYVSMQNGSATGKLAVVNLCGTDANNVPEPALVGSLINGSYKNMNGISVSGSNLYITYGWATNPFEVWTTGAGGTSPSLLGCVPLFTDSGYTTCGQTLSAGDMAGTQNGALYGGNPYVLGNYVYVPENSDDGGQAVQILDPSVPSAPVKVGGGVSSGNDQNGNILSGLWAPGSGTVLYVGTNANTTGQPVTITAYDAGQNPTTPVKLGTALNLPAGYLIQNMSVQGTTVVANLYDAFATTNPAEILVASFANPNAPTSTMILPTAGCIPGAGNFIAMQNGYAFFGCGSPSTSPTGIEVVKVSNPAAPVLLGQIATSLTRVNFIVPEGRYLFAVDGSSGTNGGNFDTIDTGSLFVP